FRPNCIGSVRVGHLGKQLLINCTRRFQTVCFLISHECLAEKLAHLPVDLARTKLVIIEKNLQPHARLLVVNREGDQLTRGRSRGGNWCWDWCRQSLSYRSWRWGGRPAREPASLRVRRNHCKRQAQC